MQSRFWQCCTVSTVYKRLQYTQCLTIPIWQGWEFALSLIRSFAHSLFALSLKIAHFKEGPWAILSCRSLQKSKLLLSLFKKEQCELFAHDSSEGLAIKWAIRSKNSYFSYVFDSFPLLFLLKSELLPSLFAHLLFFKERLKQFALVALYKRATMSDSLKSLMTFSIANCSFAHKKRANRCKNQWANSQPCHLEGFYILQFSNTNTHLQSLSMSSMQ